MSDQYCPECKHPPHGKRCSEQVPVNPQFHDCQCSSGILSHVPQINWSFEGLPTGETLSGTVLKLEKERNDLKYKLERASYYQQTAESETKNLRNQVTAIQDALWEAELWRRGQESYIDAVIRVIADAKSPKCKHSQWGAPSMVGSALIQLCLKCGTARVISA